MFLSDSSLERQNHLYRRKIQKNAQQFFTVSSPLIRYILITIPTHQSSKFLPNLINHQPLSLSLKKVVKNI
ncbi:hypothetical protein QVD17_36757 [Tagetes erecta]|uniref:Uncharacterized protein n=1 Tax=Tagetes erecta TaxID=13708 RepID=A0AAD8NIK7_TARER|nr:hypothetical protein QVD17_36757 [Tagetes erecta]